MYSLYNVEPVIRTSSGLFMNVFECTPEMIHIEDIAHALSNQCRFGGHVKKFYSVAEHCIECCTAAPDHLKLAALLHDASEAYLIDVPRPVKNRLSEYKPIENALMTIISEKYGFSWPMPEEVIEIDESRLRWEWDNIMLKEPNVSFMSHEDAKENFLLLFDRYKLKQYA